MKNVLKGIIIGAAMLVPGVSGGTMAIILNVYDRLLRGVSNFTKDVKRYGVLLLQFAFGGLVGIVALSGLLLDLVTAYERTMMYLFLGAIAGSVFPLYRKATIDRVKPVNIVAAAIGFICCALIMFIPKELFSFGAELTASSFFMLILAGVIVAVAIVLPGISASYVLLMLGMYDVTLHAIRYMELFYLAPLAIGALVGTFVTAGILERAMRRHPQFTYMLIIGFVLGSLIDVFPGLPGTGDAVSCLLAAAAGFGTVYWLGMKARD